jgi:hypothetical protein
MTVAPVSQWSLRRPFGPQKIMCTQTLKISDRMSESQLLRHMEALAQKNHAKKSFIGMGYVGYGSEQADPFLYIDGSLTAYLLFRSSCNGVGLTTDSHLMPRRYYGCHVPAVIQRNVLENPGWYTQVSLSQSIHIPSWTDRSMQLNDRHVILYEGKCYCQ